ncbi:MAG: nicotinate-nucleotide adenylyltransferase [Gammaproteobacteria bacterium]|nr:nicotinate-nucleotide adenylyltransferase [Gammaproteobacteria bacterium]
MIGIFGGTFDPIHYGHLRPVNEVQRVLKLSEVRVIPAALPPHRDTPSASAADRLAMVELALKEYPQFVVDDRELKREGLSYTLDTLESLAQELPESIFCLLIGGDAFLSFNTWHRWQDLLTLAHIVVMQRPGWSTEHKDTIPMWARKRVCDSASALSRESAGQVWLQPVKPVDISGTQVRTMVSRGKSVKGLVPAAVAEYIEQHHLYSV